MDQLEKLLEDFKTDQDIKKFLQSRNLSRSRKYPVPYPVSSPGQTKPEIRSQLSSVMKALSGYIEELGREKGPI